MKPVMQVYAADNLKKLAIFHELAQKIDLFQRIINSRFLYKEIRVDKTFGFALFSTLNPKKEIPLSALSSGEQHELVLFYQLLFDLQPHSLILIDEPEISLHVSWQNHFIDDLKAVIKLNPIDILIATHSPSIVGSHWDLTVQLKGVETEASV
jgi:predicted ATP-binding protein involved in virulence